MEHSASHNQTMSMEGIFGNDNDGAQWHYGNTASQTPDVDDSATPPCPICKERLSVEYITCDNDHACCWECMDNWVQAQIDMSQMPRCPVCRVKMSVMPPMLILPSFSIPSGVKQIMILMEPSTGDFRAFFLPVDISSLVPSRLISRAGNGIHRTGAEFNPQAQPSMEQSLPDDMDGTEDEYESGTDEGELTNYSS
jgi:hypothetical protein